MTDSYFYVNVFLLAVGTFCIRFIFIALSGTFKISANLRELFSFIPAALFPALILPVVFFHDGKIEWLLQKERFFVLIIAVMASYVVRNTLFTIALGLSLLLLVTQVSPL